MLTARGKSAQVVTVDGHDIRLTNLDKVLYPATGTTKRDVIEYYAAIASTMLAHVSDRPVTRKRWPNGVDEQPFFQKDLGAGTPDWVVRRTIEHRHGSNDYPLVDDAATLVWLAQIASLEIHVPQWTFGPRGAQHAPDRLVLDLDPGEGAGLPECVEVARLAREILDDMGLEPVPVTSGSKGIHLYAVLDGRQSAKQVTAVAHDLARALEADHPDLVVSDMKRALRGGKVLVDWSQNNGNKTTVAPYSLRGRARPWVAAPRTWRELASSRLRQLTYDEVLTRVRRRGDPLADASPPSRDSLEAYRAKRDPAKTSEPVPPGPPEPRHDGRSFVIQEHHARRLHWDFRLERDGVLVSWALPKGEPTDPGRNHLAVQTEDHPYEYGSFEGSIAKGEYGAGNVSIWDSGTYDLEKWKDDEIIVVLHSDRGERHEQRGDRRLALVRTERAPGDGEHGTARSRWLIHRTTSQDGVSAVSGAGSVRTYDAMLATLGKRGDLVGSGTDEGEWAFEMKWDGIRTVARVEQEAGRTRVSMTSRNGKAQGPTYPELVGERGLAGAVHGEAVVDGEIVALDAKGRPDFGRLQQRMNVADPREIEAMVEQVPVQLFLFDVLEVAGEPVTDRPYTERRELIQEVVAETPIVKIPPAFEGDFDGAWKTSAELALEGVMAKRVDSTYAPGRRSREWIKVKHARTQEIVVGGWRPGKGNRAGQIGSLLTGVPDGDGHLHYVGRVGTGFTDAALREAGERLARLARKTSPLDDVPRPDAADARWVTPRLVGEVEFAEWTGDGRLRQPRWRGWRPDKDPGDVRRE